MEPPPFYNCFSLFGGFVPLPLPGFQFKNPPEYPPDDRAQNIQFAPGFLFVSAKNRPWVAPSEHVRNPLPVFWRKRFFTPPGQTSLRQPFLSGCAPIRDGS